jgi:Bifunctional DNA primase/polymerase, N-terminal/Primase C terminal 1 (PriCT-1)
VVDVDSLDAEAELKKLEREYGDLPATVESITARGRHLFFEWPGKPVRNSAGKIAPGVDVKGDGGYVLAPPSVHPTGKNYAWSVDGADIFTPAPNWLLARANGSNGSSGTGVATPPVEWRAIATGVAEGARDCTGAKLVGHLLRKRVDPIVVLELLRGWNLRCTPPLPEEDIDRIVESIASRELKRRSRT